MDVHGSPEGTDPRAPGRHVQGTVVPPRAQTSEILTARARFREGGDALRVDGRCDFRPGGRSAQCAASRQVRPMPTPTSSGTDSS